jgi:enoyl-CoA hydratase/carnithine racemase
MSEAQILVEIPENGDGGVMEVVFNRPERKNALTLKMYALLSEALDRASSDPAIRAVILRGSTEIFTSGNDLNDFMQAPPTGEGSPVFGFLKAISHFEKPLIGAVAGPAVGVGATMLLHCDLVYAADSARFHFPFVNLAVVPEAGSTYLLPRMVGHQRAAELLFFGDPFGAQEAKAVGMVNAIFPAEGLLEAAREKAGILAKKPAAVLRKTKALLKAGVRDHAWETMRREGDHFIEMLQSPELAEAITAFFEKRQPDFSKFD